MTIIDKIALLNLDEKETEKATEKFMAALSLISGEELREVLKFLTERGVTITRAKDIKVLTIPTEELEKKFSILDEIHETDLYVRVPSTLALNVIDVYKKLKYCSQNGIGYKDGLEYDKAFVEALRNEEKWREFLGSREKAPVEPNDLDLGGVDKNDEVELTIDPDDPGIPLDNVMDFSDLASDEEDLTARTTSFEALKKDLEMKMRNLDDDLNPNGSMYTPDTVISFEDLEPEAYGINPGEPARGGR